MDKAVGSLGGVWGPFSVIVLMEHPTAPKSNSSDDDFRFS